MANAIKIIRTGTAKWLRESEIENIIALKEIAKNSGFEILQRKEGAIKFVRFRQKKLPTFLVTSEKNVKFLCLSDLHITSLYTNKQKIQSVLRMAKKVDVQYVFISGDLCEGIHMGKNHDKTITTDVNELQANEVVKILQEFDFKYYAIAGNHDFSFELENQINPLEIIEEKMKDRGRFFKFIPSFQASLVISDFAMNLIHIDSGFAHCNTKQPCIQYFEKVVLKKPLEVKHTEKNYPLKIVQVGHMHNHFRKNYKLNQINIHILQPGSAKKNMTNYSIGFIVNYSNGKFEFMSL